MNIIAAEGKRYVLNLARGEELFLVLASWCQEKKIEGATLTGLGAASNLEIAYYNLETKTYERQIITEDVEILSLTGNVAMLGEKTALHIHGVFGRRDLSTFGGHVFALTVSGACELHIEIFESSMTRAHDEVTGLNLLCGI